MQATGAARTVKAAAGAAEEAEAEARLLLRLDSSWAQTSAAENEEETKG